jgi:hypothetical protein
MREQWESFDALRAALVGVGVCVLATRAARSGLEVAEPGWQASVFQSLDSMAVEAWRLWGSPDSSWNPSPGGLGLRHKTLKLGPTDILAFDASGRALGPKSLVDWGSQLARQQGLWARWEDGWRPSWRVVNWPGWGPVPGCGKGRAGRFGRQTLLGGGARKRWMGEILSGAGQLKELEGSEAFGATSSRWGREARALGDDFMGRWDRSPRSNERCWKRASGKSRKSWGPRL